MKRLALLAVCAALLLGGARASVAVRMEDTAALISEDGGEIVAEGVYEDIVPLGGGLFAATKDGARYALMRGDGELLTFALYDELRLCGDVLCARRDGGWGLLGLDGAERGAFAYDEVLYDGAGGLWALRGAEGLTTVLLPDADGSARDSGLRVRDCGAPAEGLLPVEMEDGRWGWCDAEGAMAIPADFEWAGSFISGRAPAVLDGHYGAVDAAGAWVAAPEYDFLEISAEGFILAAGERGVTVLDADGSTLAEYAGEGVWGALAGADYVVGDANALRVYDASGTLLEELGPDAAVSEGVGAQLVLSEGMWGERCVRLSGTEALYQNLFPLGTLGDEALYACMEVGAARYENGLLGEIQVSVDMDSARYGVVNGAGEQLLPGRYRSIEYLGNDRLLVRADRMWRVIDTKGRGYWNSRVRQTAAPSF